MPKLTKSAPKSAKQARMHQEMHKFKEGTLKIGKSNKSVRSRAQAVAIGLSESGQSKRTGKKVGQKR